MPSRMGIALCRSMRMSLRVPADWDKPMNEKELTAKSINKHFFHEPVVIIFSDLLLQFN
jgi:hypothetical protein